jgi:hypothetical protein
VYRVSWNYKKSETRDLDEIDQKPTNRRHKDTKESPRKSRNQGDRNESHRELVFVILSV